MNQSMWKRYWRAYGGLSALFKSKYLWSSIFVTACLYPIWMEPFWWEDVLGIVPNLLGFSLGGYAMWIAIGDSDFRQLISGEEIEGATSPYMEVNASFVHFMVLQLTAVMIALFAKAFNFALPQDSFVLFIFGDSFKYISLFGYFLGYLIFVYALFSAIAATMALLRVSHWYDFFQTEERRKAKSQKMND